jgi:hypothetical protein
MEKTIRIPANQDEITLYCFMGESLLKIQHVEQALSCSITIKLNPTETREKADEFLELKQRFTLGQAINLATKENLYSVTLQEELNNFLVQRNWLVHKAVLDIQMDFNDNNKEELFKKIKAISDKAEYIQHEVEYDMINFCSARGTDMSKIAAQLNLQKQGVRIQG